MSLHSKNNSILFPTAQRFSPSEQNYSPLAQFSALTLQEHETAARNLKTQQEHIIQASAHLAAQEAEENRRHSATMTALAREEAEILHQLANNKRFRESLELRSAEEATRRKETIEVDRDERAALEDEDASLRDLEGELRTMLADMENKQAQVHERSQLFRVENQRGMSILQHDQHEAHVLATTTQRLNPTPGGIDVRATSPAGLNSDVHLLPHQQAGLARSLGLRDPSPTSRREVSPSRSEVVHGTLRTSNAYRTISPSRTAGGGSGALIGAASSRPVALSPSRQNGGLSSSTTGVVSPQRAGNATRETQRQQSSYVMQDIRRHAGEQGQPASPPSRSSGAAQVGNPYVDHSTAQAFAVAMGDSTRLHEICSSVHGTAGHTGAAVTVDDALRHIRAQPDDVNHVDQLGNTPLHVACAVDDPSLEVIHALLLAGCNATVRNADGLAPFHVACLNTTDTQHKLKKFLIFKAAQNPNLRTGKGETVAHLCSIDDKYLPTLKFLATVGVDMQVSALLTGADGVPRRMTPLDKARAAGSRASQCRAFLETLN